MPAYISHAIMANDIYNNSINDEKLFKSNVNLDSLRTFSCAIDPAELSRDLVKNPHSYYTQDFLIKIANYVKSNNLLEDENALAFLYGYMSHFFFDTSAHPFVYYIEKGCKRFSMVSPHSIVEGFLSSYYSQEILGKDLMQVKKTFFNKGNLKSVSQMMDTLFKESYEIHDIVLSYKKFLTIFTLVEWACKDTVVKKGLLKLLFTYKQFLDVNGLTEDEMVNKLHQPWIRPVTGEIHYESALDLYDAALERTLQAMDDVNQYLYGNKSIEDLVKVFPNLSYETGVDVSLGEKMIYNRSQKKLIL